MASNVNLSGIKRDVGMMVQSLARNIHDHDRSENSVPKTIKFMLSPYPDNEESIKYHWQCFVVPDTGEEVRPKDWIEFVTTNPPRGLGTTAGKVEVWVKAEMPELLPVLRDSKIPGLNDVGVNQYTGGSNTTPINGTRDNDYILARLKRDNPELAQRITDGELTPHQAAIIAGIRKKRISAAHTPDGVVKMILKYFDEEEREYIANKITQK